jgi:hypothetical protein
MQLLDYQLCLNHRSVNMSGVTYVKTERGRVEFLKYRQKFFDCSARTFTSVHILDTQQLTEFGPQIIVVHYAWMHNDRPLSGNDWFEDLGQFALCQRSEFAWRVEADKVKH